MKKTILTLAVASAITVMTGCASVTTSEISARVSQSAKTASASLMAGNQARVATRVANEPYISANASDYIPMAAGNVSISVGSADIYSVVNGIAKQANYSVSMMDNVDRNRRVTVDIRNQTIDNAIRDAAFAAGYVAVIDKKAKTVTLAEKGTYTFRVPAKVFQEIAGTYSVSGNTSGSGASQGTSQSGGATFSVSGSSKSAGLKEFEKSIKDMTGGESQVSVNTDSGLVTVRASAQQLRRVTQWIEDFVKDAMSQVEVKTSIVEVDIGDEMRFGFDWTKVLSKASGNFNFGISTAGAVPNPSMSIGYTSASIDTVIKAMENYTELRVLTQPSVMSLNHTPTVLFDGKQIPYLGQVQQNVSGTSGTVTQTGQLAYAMDGISVGITPNIMDANNAQITLVPLISTVNGFEEFVVGGTTLKAPNSPVRQTHISVIAQHGKTMIVGGTRSGKENADRTGIPGLPGNSLGKFFGGRIEGGKQKELIFLIHANIIPAPKVVTLVSESV